MFIRVNLNFYVNNIIKITNFQTDIEVLTFEYQCSILINSHTIYKLIRYFPLLTNPIVCQYLLKQKDLETDVRSS